MEKTSSFLRRVQEVAVALSHPDDRVRGRQAIRQATLWLFVLGIVLFVFGYLTGGRSAASTLEILAGITLAAVAVLLYCLSPSALLRAEVADALAAPGVVSLENVLASLKIEGRGIYLPASEAGTTKVFVPAKDEVPGEIHVSGGILVFGDGMGMLLDPPGSGLMACAAEISPALTESSLANTMTDIMENGLEIAGKVEVAREGGRVVVAMTGLASAGLCSAVRRESPGLCARIGCPVCSFAACLVADGLRRRVRIDRTEVDGKTVRATFEVL